MCRMAFFFEEPGIIPISSHIFSASPLCPRGQEQVTHLFRDLGYVLWDAQAIAEAAEEAQIQARGPGALLIYGQYMVNVWLIYV